MKRGILWAAGIVYLVLTMIGAKSFADAHWEASHVMPVSQKVILIDAGHGGGDPGKTGTQLDEKDLNLSIAKKLQTYLELGGASVLLTRSQDEMLGDPQTATKKEDMRLRGEMIREYHPDLFISIHQNSFPDSRYWGPQVFYHTDSVQGRRLAETIQKQLNVFTGGNRECKANGDYYVLKQSEDTAVLVECGFLTNPEEELRLNDENYQKKIAWSIYAGINAFFEEEENGNTMDPDG